MSFDQSVSNSSRFCGSNELVLCGSNVKCRSHNISLQVLYYDWVGHFGTINNNSVWSARILIEVLPIRLGEQIAFVNFPFNWKCTNQIRKYVWFIRNISWILSIEPCSKAVKSGLNFRIGLFFFKYWQIRHPLSIFKFSLIHGLH